MKLLLIHLLLTACLSLGTAASAASHRISWSVTPPQVGVSFRVVRVVDGSAPVTLGETTVNSILVEASPGDRIAIIATSPFFDDAPPSDPIEIPPAPIDPAAGVGTVEVVMESSDDLKVWNERVVLMDDKGVSRFYRVRIRKIKNP